MQQQQQIFSGPIFHSLEMLAKIFRLRLKK